ncbi:MAG TPA: hypothetical protein VNT81_14245 [Vicinamibacterales bacterium]|nr:hypothetical protein [Vicinamibacterales bacterium]
MRGCAGAWALVIALLCAREAAGQVLPEQPISIFGGHVVFGAEVTATFAPEDPGFFNYTSYEFSALRNVRLGVSTEIRANDRIQILGEVRLDQGRVLEAYGLFVRVRPWPSRRFAIQAGRVPPTFGAMTRTSYGTNNLLIGQPLAYQYLTSIRPDALPATPDDLLRMRGRGWLSNFPRGNNAPAPGLPLVNTSEWDTGVQAHGVTGMVEWIGAVTTGSLSDPRFRDNNSGRQLSGRVAVRPAAAIAIGVSAARGAWLNQPLEDDVAGESADRAQQVAFGADAEYSAGPFLVRGEVIRSAWQLPMFGDLQLQEPLVAIASLLEGRYKIAPGLYVAMRGDRLDFSSIRGSRGLTEWEAQTWRFETGVGYSITRNVIVKASWQKNGRDGGRIRKDALYAGQVLYWF